MEEPELLEILSQCEDEGSRSPPWHSVSHMTCHVEITLLPKYHQRLSLRRPPTSSVQPLALRDSNPLGDMFQVMAARLYEEEQTQRTMVALKEMAPFYPGKSQSEVQTVLERVSNRSCDHHMINHVSHTLNFH